MTTPYRENAYREPEKKVCRSEIIRAAAAIMLAESDTYAFHLGDVNAAYYTTVRVNAIGKCLADWADAMRERGE